MGNKHFADSKLGSCLALLSLKLNSSHPKEFYPTPPKLHPIVLPPLHFVYSVVAYGHKVGKNAFSGLSPPPVHTVKLMPMLIVYLSQKSVLRGETGKNNVCAGYTTIVNQF